jgi:hypothetical protein
MANEESTDSFDIDYELTLLGIDTEDKTTQTDDLNLYSDNLLLDYLRLEQNIRIGLLLRTTLRPKGSCKVFNKTRLKLVRKYLAKYHNSAATRLLLNNFMTMTQAELEGMHFYAPSCSSCAKQYFKE